MRRLPAGWLLALAITTSAPLGAQSAPAATVGKPVPVSDIRRDWLGGGVESPNGRFYLLSSYAAPSNDSGWLRYDRSKRSWAYLGRGNIGAQPRWSPNGRFVAYLRQAEESRQWFVWVMPMDTATGLASGPARRVSTRPGSGPGTGPAAWSPDGRRIAFIAPDSGRISIVAVPFNGGDEQLLFDATGHLNSVFWSPDGRSIFVNHGAPNRSPRTLRVSLDDKRSVDLGEAYGPIIDISPDGKWLAQYGRVPMLYLMSTDGKSPRRVDLRTSLTERLIPSGWSHTNPNEMVALDHIVPTGIQRVSIADGRIRTVVPFDSAGIRGGSLSPDERQLAYTRLHDGVPQLVVSDATGGNVRLLVNGARSSEGWSPNGRHIAYTTGQMDIRVVDVSSKQTRELLPAVLEPCTPQRPNCEGRLPNVVWRSDGSALRYFERRSIGDRRVLELREVDLNGRQRVVGTSSLLGNPSFIARNDTLFLVRQPTAVQLVNARTGDARVIYSGDARVSWLVDANGEWIVIVVVSGGNGTPWVEQPMLVSLKTGESKKYPYQLGGEVSQGDFLPDGRNVLLTACVSCRDPGFVEKWDIILAPMNGDPPRILTGSESNFKDFWPIAVTKDGGSVFFAAQESYNTRIVTITLPKQ